MLEGPYAEGFEVVTPFIADEDTSRAVVFVLRMRLSIASSLHTLPGVVEKPIVSLELPVPFRFPFSCFHFGTPCLGRQFRLLPPFFLFAFAQPHCFRRPHYLSNRRTSLHYLMSTIETTQPMPQVQLGKIERIPVRDVWRHEALDFTKWLAQEENLTQLGEACSIDLEFVDVESAVGSFAVVVW